MLESVRQLFHIENIRPPHLDLFEKMPKKTCYADTILGMQGVHLMPMYLWSKWRLTGRVDNGLDVTSEQMI